MTFIINYCVQTSFITLLYLLSDHHGHLKQPQDKTNMFPKNEAVSLWASQ